MIDSIPPNRYVFNNCIKGEALTISSFTIKYIILSVRAETIPATKPIFLFLIFRI